MYLQNLIEIQVFFINLDQVEQVDHTRVTHACQAPEVGSTLLVIETTLGFLVTRELQDLTRFPLLSVSFFETRGVRDY